MCRGYILLLALKKKKKKKLILLYGRLSSYMHSSLNSPSSGDIWLVKQPSSQSDLELKIKG